MDLATLAVAAIVGVGIGILSGMLGIGGGTVMVPVFKLGFGMSAIGATATSLLAIIPTAISGGATHVRQRTCIPKLGVLAGIGGACFSPVGVWLASLSPGWLIMLAAACVIGYSAYTMLKKALAMGKGKGEPAASGGSSDPAALGPEPAGGAPRAFSMGSGRVAHSEGPAGKPPAGSGPRADNPASDPQSEGSEADSQQGGGNPKLKRSVYWGLGIGALAGLAAGYVGVGGGFLMVPLFISVIGADMKRASGSSLLAIGILSTPGAVLQIVLGNAAIAIAIAVVVGSVPGAVLGAKLAKRIPERELRFAFAGILFVAAVLLVLQELGMF